MDIPDTLREALRLHGNGDLAGAAALYEQVLAHAPGNPDALHFLGVAHMQSERFETAAALMGDAARAMPGNADVHSNLGVALRALGREADAARAFRNALDVNPSHPNAGYNLAIALRNLGRRDEAIDAMRLAVAQQPQAAERHCDLAGLLLESGRAAEALPACDACLALAPRDALAMSYKATALAQSGNTRAATDLLAMDRVVQARRLPLPPGWTDESALCEALAQYVCNHSTLRAPQARATTHGRQTGDLLGGGQPVAQALEQLIDRAVTDYLSSLTVDPTHPYLAARPGEWDLTAWGVVLDDHGHQASHAHPTGWVSGVFYVALPDAIQDQDSDHAGWIEFGRPPEEIPMPVDPPVQLFAPRRGMMVLFPAYLYHRTIPFRSTQPRISIAFDARPHWDRTRQT